MAKIKLKSYIKSAHGRLGNVIYYNVKGNQYARSYSIPKNPRTEAQQKNRATFACAVKQWQKLPAVDRHVYNRMAEGKSLSGYNIFISMQMRGINLKLLRQVLRGNSPYSDSCLRASTSASPSSSFAQGTYIISSGANFTYLTIKKPPGVPVQAA